MAYITIPSLHNNRSVASVQFETKKTPGRKVFYWNKLLNKHKNGPVHKPSHLKSIQQRRTIIF